MVEVLVLLLFDFLVGGPQHRGGVAGKALDDLADEFPVEVVLGLCQGHALGGHDLGLLRSPASLGERNGLHQRLARVADDLARSGDEYLSHRDGLVSRFCYRSAPRRSIRRGRDDRVFPEATTRLGELESRLKRGSRAYREVEEAVISSIAERVVVTSVGRMVQQLTARPSAPEETHDELDGILTGSQTVADRLLWTFRRNESRA